MNELNNSGISLTSLVKSSGCAAKIAPRILHEVLDKLPKFNDPNLLVGFDTNDDACVYKINDSTAVIQTVDFFPPMVDDPYSFGQIAAANALSDIYAMGVSPATAMNLMCFPSCLDISIMEAILAGGHSKVMEAGAIIAGGHTIADPTPKYGLCATGFANPNQILTNSNAIAGDVLVLTKPLGIGIMNTAAKAELLDAAAQNATIEIMSTLNKHAMESANGLCVHACTDITGFGLTGHACEMAYGSQMTLEIYTAQLPLIKGCMEFASMGLIPEGMYNNLEYLKDKFTLRNAIPQNLLDILMDPQTSGGLLLSMPEADAREYVSRMELHSPWTHIIGQVLPMEHTHIVFY